MVYSTTCSVRVMFDVSGLMTAAQSSTVAFATLKNAMIISTELFVAPALLYPPWWEVCCSFHRYDCASMNCAWIFPGLFRIRLGVSGPAVFLEMSCLRNKAICNAFNLSFSARLARHSCVINALVEPRVEDLKRLIGVEGLLHILVVGRKSPGQYPGVVAIDISEEGQWCGAGVSYERLWALRDS